MLAPAEELPPIKKTPTKLLETTTKVPTVAHRISRRTSVLLVRNRLSADSYSWDPQTNRQTSAQKSTECACHNDLSISARISVTEHLVRRQIQSSVVTIVRPHQSMKRIVDLLRKQNQKYDSSDKPFDVSAITAQLRMRQSGVLWRLVKVLCAILNLSRSKAVSDNPSSLCRVFENASQAWLVWTILRQKSAIVGSHPLSDTTYSRRHPVVKPKKWQGYQFWRTLGYH